MRSLKLSEWTNIAEIIASIAIIVSLVYVGLQVKQNTYGFQQSSYQHVLDILVQGDMALAQDAELHRLVTSAMADPKTVPAEEWSRFSHFMFPRIGIWEYIYLARQENALNEFQWTAFEPYFRTLACETGVKKFWQENRNGFAASFNEYVARLIEKDCASE